jgi:ABC-type phosphate transport system substrate-binding protein
VADQSAGRRCRNRTVEPPFGAEIDGAGATFPNPIYQEWASEYHQATGEVVDYQPVGSGLGVKSIEQDAVTFGASDMPLDSACRDQTELRSLTHNAVALVKASWKAIQGATL